MMCRPGLLGKSLGLFFVAAIFVFAQDWSSLESLNGVDLGGLSPEQKTKVLKVLRSEGCSCGCTMKIAECRVKDPGCTYSKGLAGVIIKAVRDGKTEAEAVELAEKSSYATGPKRDDRILGDPVTIPVMGAPLRGPENAKITIVEFSDFQCPYCIAAFPQVETLLKAYPTEIKLIFKQFPLDLHSQAAIAANAAISAQKQGRFWQMHDAIFSEGGHLSRDILIGLAKKLDLDMARFGADLDSKETRESVQRDENDGIAAGVQGTPTLFINGQRYNGPIQYIALKQIIDAKLKETVAPAVQARR